MKVSFCIILFICFCMKTMSCDVVTPFKHHMKKYNLVLPLTPIIDEVDLNNDNQKDYIVTTRDQCGTRGCEYSIYIKGRDCYEFSGQFQGNYSILDKIKGPTKIIQVRYRDTHLSIHKNYQLIFDNGKKLYREPSR